MNARTQRLCAWCGPVMILFWAVGFAALAHFVPPPGPRTDAHQWAALIRDHLTPIRFGLVLTVLGSALLAPFVGVISVQMKRIEGRDSPLAYAQLVLGACLIMEFVFPMATIQAATYRPERAEELILLLTDLAWVWFFGIASTVVLEAVLVGIVILRDTDPMPRFPRWAGYVSVWAGLLFSPGSFLIFFKDGPMAWNGLLVFWVPIGSFAVWLAVMVTLMVRAAAGPESDRPEGGRPGSGPAGDEPGLSRRVEELSGELAELRAQLARIGGGPGPAGR